MASGTFHGRKGLLSVVTDAAAFTLVHGHHDDFRAALLHRKGFRMAYVAGIRSVTIMEELDRSGPLDLIVQGTRSLLRRCCLAVSVTAAAVRIK